MGVKFVRFAEVCKYLSHRVTELSHTIQARAVARAYIILICNLHKKQEPQLLLRLLQFLILKNMKNFLYEEDLVVPPGIEPGTQGFSVLCSTN